MSKFIFNISPPLLLHHLLPAEFHEPSYSKTEMYFGSYFVDMPQRSRPCVLRVGLMGLLVRNRSTESLKSFFFGSVQKVHAPWGSVVWVKSIAYLPVGELVKKSGDFECTYFLDAPFSLSHLIFLNISSTFKSDLFLFLR